MVRFLSAETDLKKIQEGFYSMFTLILIFSFIISIVILIFSKGIALSLFNGNVGVVKVLSLLIIFGTLNGILIDFFVTIGQMKKYSILLILQTYISLFY